MPIDINFLRKDRGGDPDFWRQNQINRFCDPGLVDLVLSLDDRWRVVTTQLRDIRKEYGLGNKKVADKKKKGEDATEEIAVVVALDGQIKEMEAELKSLETQRDANLGKIANIMDPSVPISKDEANNAVVCVHGERRIEEGLYHHHELLWMIDGYEPDRGTAIAGHRAYFLKGVGVQLNQALINYGLAFLRERAYTALQTPYFMNQSVMAGVAQLSEFDETLYNVVSGEGEEKKYLIATSEQPICAYHKDDWLQEKELPRRYAGYSTCFRKEAGSAGKDAWGIFRVHQFEKVEQFCITEPENSAAMQEEMITIAMDFYKSLGFAFHVVNIVSGELNNAAAKKYDLEAWFPTLGVYRELVSCSNCTDYQSRAMEIRCGVKKADDKTKKYVHMLNATLCATTRTICCILENYQTKTGVKVPDVLVPFMGGLTFIPFTRAAPEKSAAIKKAEALRAGGDATVPAPKPTPTPTVPKTTTPTPAPTQPKTTGGAGGKPQQQKPASTKTTPAPKPTTTATTDAVSSSTDPLAKLNAALLHQPYVGGFRPTKADDAEFKKLGSTVVDAATYPNVARWQRNMGSYTAAQRAAFL